MPDLMRVYERAKSWYIGLPWYWKILGVLFLVVLFLLLIAAFILRAGKAPDKKDSDVAHENTVDAAMEGYEEQDKVLEDELKAKKKKAYILVNQKRKIDARALEARKEITEASSFEEVDAALGKLGLCE